MPQFDVAAIEPKTIAPGYSAKFVHTLYMTLSFVEVKAGSILPAHAHMQEQISQLVSGSFELTVDGEPILLEKDQVVVIPPNVVHSGKALTDCTLFDIFSPVRKDYKNLQ
jgi:quercetin dioxygenase-like cupin family protein